MPYSNHIIQKLTLTPLASPRNWIIIWTLKRCTESIVHSNVYFPNIWDDNKSRHTYHTYFKIFMMFLFFFKSLFGILSKFYISTQVPLRIGTVATSDVVSRSKEPAVRKRGTRSFQRLRFKLLSCFFWGNEPAWLFPLPRLWPSLLITSIVWIYFNDSIIIIIVIVIISIIVTVVVIIIVIAVIFFFCLLIVILLLFLLKFWPCVQCFVDYHSFAPLVVFMVQFPEFAVGPVGHIRWKSCRGS